MLTIESGEGEVVKLHRGVGRDKTEGRASLAGTMAHSAREGVRPERHTAMRDNRSGFDIAERPGGAANRLGGGRADHPNPLLDRRRHLISQVGRAVVGQALEIGSDQRFVGRWEGAALTAIDLRGEHDDEFAACPLV